MTENKKFSWIIAVFLFALGIVFGGVLLPHISDKSDVTTNSEVGTSEHEQVVVTEVTENNRQTETSKAEETQTIAETVRYEETTEPYFAVSRYKMYSDDYILPTDIEYIRQSDLDKFTYDEMDYVTNEIYARHGYIFKSPDLAMYFESKPWYKGKTTSMNEVEREFSTIENANLQLIVDYEKAKGWREGGTTKVTQAPSNYTYYYPVSRYKMYSDDYILPTDVQRISVRDLEKFTYEEMDYVTNEIYARHGYIFKSPDLARYFESKSWYKGTVSDMGAVEQKFSSVENANLQTIVSYEKSKGWR